MKTVRKQNQKKGEKRFVFVEYKVPRKPAKKLSPLQSAKSIMNKLNIEFDELFEPISIEPTPFQKKEMKENKEDNLHYVLCTSLDTEEEQKIMRHASVVALWDNPEIHEADWSPGGGWENIGRLERVKEILELNELRIDAQRGRGIVVGVVDAGITATGRMPVTPAPRNIDDVIGGYPFEDWGRYSHGTDHHGNMMAYIIKSIAPECKLLDLRIFESGSTPFIRRLDHAMQCYKYAIELYRGTIRISGYPNGIPQVLTNSWCLYQRRWLPDGNIYAQNMEHPFTRMVIEAIQTGIIVLFCAGNSGLPSPNDRSGSLPSGLIDPAIRDANTGPEKSIWGANAHPRVITVGAVTILNERIGYSSQGPAIVEEQDATGALVRKRVAKPDFCSFSAFFGGYDPAVINSGTSSSTAVTAGVIALLKAAHPTLTHDRAKEALLQTAINTYTHAGWHPNTGTGTIHAGAAHRYLRGLPPYVFGRPERE